MQNATATKSQALADKVRTTLSAHGVRILGARGSAGLMAFTMPADDIELAHELLTMNFGWVDGLTITAERWDGERAATYARNVPAEKGAGGRVRLVF